jgi:hypothetical protein
VSFPPPFLVSAKGLFGVELVTLLTIGIDFGEVEEHRPDCFCFICAEFGVDFLEQVDVDYVSDKLMGHDSQGLKVELISFKLK